MRTLLARHQNVAAYVIFTAFFIVSLFVTTHETSNTNDALARVVAAQMQDTERVNFALCQLRDNIQQRVTESTAFLKAHPGGLPGIATKQEIETSLEQQQENLDALEVLNCSTKKE